MSSPTAPTSPAPTSPAPEPAPAATMPPSAEAAAPDKRPQTSAEGASSGPGGGCARALVRTLTQRAIGIAVDELHKPETQQRIKTQIISPLTRLIYTQLFPYVLAAIVVVTLMLLMSILSFAMFALFVSRWGVAPPKPPTMIGLIG